MRGSGVTDKGMVRAENQDCYQLEIMNDSRRAVAVLCDGMGGAQAGSVASSIAAESFMTHIKACFASGDAEEGELTGMVQEACDYANIRVYDRSFAAFDCMGMGTTLVGALIQGETGIVVNVGDSRAYQISDGEITQITRDHSLVEELVQCGAITREEAKTHPNRNVITRALGAEQRVQCDLFGITFREGDQILLCSDGLSNLVSEAEMLAASSEGPDRMTENLLQMALGRGASDNVTVVVLQQGAGD